MLGALLKQWPRILRDTAILTVVLTLASFLLRNQFTASAVVLPPSAGSDLSSVVSGGAGALALSRAIGLDPAGGAELYVGVLRSATINRRLVERFGLMPRYRAADVEKAGRVLAGHTAVNLTNEGFIRVSVTEPDARLAADLSNAYVAELDHFLQTNTNTSARRRREFLERRLVETRASLVIAEDALRDYQVKQHLPAITGDVDRAASAAGTLVGEKASREIELGTLRSVSRGPNPRAEQLRAEISQIELEISKIPPAATAAARLYRSVKIQEGTLLVLTEEQERARLLELKDTPSVEVVDAAVPPLHKSQPRRALLAAGAFAILLVANAALAWGREGALVRP